MNKVDGLLRPEILNIVKLKVEEAKVIITIEQVRAVMVAIIWMQKKLNESK